MRDCFTRSFKRPTWWGLTPLAVFLIVYFITGLLFLDFYKMPITVAFLISSAYAVAITPDMKLEQRIMRFSQGASDKNILLMIWIFILAGAFAEGAKSMGAINAGVHAALSILPPDMVLPGLFLAACFISVSIGTSVGTIVALMPVALGLAQPLALDVAYIAGIVAGGAFFGDNLSFISDTTIATTRTQGCDMKDKFKVNLRIVLPAALVVLVIYIVQGSHLSSHIQHEDFSLILIIPYLIVLGCAIYGMNVVAVLSLGIVSCGIVGTITGSVSFFDWIGSLGKGIGNMGELIIVTMLAGGMLELIKYNGGIDFVIKKLTQNIKSKRGAELAIAALVSIANLCTANNTIAILTTGPIAREISEKYALDARKSASILDTFSCFIQGIIPYGAQLLIASGLAALSPVSIIGYLYYPLIMGITALLSIILRYPRKYS
ncbi:Na+/H+ antiporter NhaC family protein [Porphyromonas pogonae]|uniref:Na+/H+ antiporter NhaC family protein n=1 Tax=Porphyromonas pogonae TaxID=867595 RepID=UPI002E79FB0C|nr:Na+/H+ antiporter NhaC family protein [Porphyromonas pogonae]